MLRLMTTADIIPFGRKSAKADEPTVPASGTDWDSVADMLQAVVDQIRDGTRKTPVDAVLMLTTELPDGKNYSFNILRYGLNPTEMIGRMTQAVQQTCTAL